MATVIYGSDKDFSVIAHGLPSQATVEYLHNQFQSIDRSMFRDTSFIDNAYGQYMQNYSEDAINEARTILNSTNNWFRDNSVRYISDMLGFQTANPTMQRYIMANPFVRQMYHEDRCNGYIETYCDNDRGMIGESHYDYRRVMNGIITDDEESPFVVNYYLEALRDGDEELLDQEQLDILSTWDILTNLLQTQREDPTDIFGGSL